MNTFQTLAELPGIFCKQTMQFKTEAWHTQHAQKSSVISTKYIEQMILVFRKKIAIYVQANATHRLENSSLMCLILFLPYQNDPSHVSPPGKDALRHRRISEK